MNSTHAIFMCFLGYASLSTVSLNNCFKVTNEPYQLTITLMENKEMIYVVDFNKTIEAISCTNEISNSSLKFRYRNYYNKAAVESNIVGTKETEGKWNCELWMEKQCRLKYSFMVAVKWVTPSPIPTSSTSKTTTTTETFQPSNIIRSTTEIPDLPSSSTGPPIAPTEATNTDTQVQWWKAVVGAAASLLILGFIIGVYVYRRKKTTKAPQSDDSEPQSDGQSNNERVYYTIYDDDEIYYSYAFCKPEPTDTNAAANAIYNVAN